LRIFKNLGYPVGKLVQDESEDLFTVLMNRYELQCIEDALHDLKHERTDAETEIINIITGALQLHKVVKYQEKLYYDALLNREVTAKEILEHTNQLLNNWKQRRKEIRQQWKYKNKKR
jgi:hypothetical protein